MLYSIALPILYLFAGFAIGHIPLNIKGMLAKLLTQYIIPLVIIYNISTHQEGMIGILLGTIIIMAALLIISTLITKKRIESLCFCYLNIGWLGLPIGTAIWGDSAATVLISAYIGSSLFGNIISTGLLTTTSSWRNALKRVLLSPVMLATILGIACIPLSKYMTDLFSFHCQALKFLMSFFGMSVLGIWLSQSEWKLRDAKRALCFFPLRALISYILVSILILYGDYYSISLITHNKLALYFMCILPPAANIIVLETHYLKSGESTPIVLWETLLSILILNGVGAL